MNIRHGLLGVGTGAGLALLAITAMAAHDGGQRSFRVEARLAPANEVPALSSTARGHFKATVDPVNQTISYELSYGETEGAVSQAHIHIGQRGVNGAVSVFLCGNPPAAPAAPAPTPPLCPVAPATVTGVLTPAHIVGPAAQGIAPTSATANEFAELVEMIRSGLTYANVHSAKFAPGEIRGQIRPNASRNKRDR